MKKPNIEYALLKELKSKNENDIFYTILSILNKTYHYQIDFLNRASYDEILIYLEKIVVIGSKCTSFESEEEIINAILEFAKRKDSLRYHHLRKNTFLNIKYSSKIMFSQIKSKQNAIKVSSLLLTVVLLFGLYSKELKANSENANFDIGIQIEESIEQNIDEETLGYENNTLVDNKEISQTEDVVTSPIEETQEENVLEDTSEKELTNEEKLGVILETYGLTEEEFNIVCAICMTESKPNSYVDTYCVINTMYNRTISKLWHIDMEKIYGEGAGYSLFYQAIAPTQFVVYEDGKYLQYLGVKEGPCYQAVIDFLYTKNIKHDFLSFRSSNTEVEGGVQFVPGGNKYFNPLQLEDRISIDKSR